MNGAEGADEVLMAHFYGGDDEALRSLIERHQNRLRATANRMLRGRCRDPLTMADDVVQQVWLHVRRTRGGGLTPWQPPHPVGYWLRHVVLPSRVEDYLRGERRHEAVSLSSGGPPARGGQIDVPDRRPDRGTEAALGLALLELLNAMPQEQHQVFELRHLDGLTVAQIVAQTGLSQAGVYRLLHEAEVQVEAFLRPWGE